MVTHDERIAKMGNREIVLTDGQIEQVLKTPKTSAYLYNEKVVLTDGQN